MDAKEKSRQHFDAIASDYNKSGDGKFVNSMYRPLITEIMTVKGGKLLDIGCGNGNLFGLLDHKKYDLYGIDFSDNMIAEAKVKYGDIAKLYTSDAAALPFDEGTFDIIICNASFHHYTEPDAVIREMSRVIKPGGTLLIGDPYVPGPFRWLANMMTKYSDHGDYHFYSKDEMHQLLAAHGFVLKNAACTGKRTILFKAIKKGGIIR